MSGFTIVEVLIVLVLISAFFVFSTSAFRQNDDARHISTGDVLASHLRYAQMRSMDSGTSWGIRYESGSNSYWLYRYPDAESRVILPGESGDTVTLDSAIVVSQSSFRLRFDDWGRPIGLTGPIASDLTLTLTMPGQPNRDIVVIQHTGFVQWQP